MVIISLCADLVGQNPFVESAPQEPSKNHFVQKAFLCVKLANAYYATGDRKEGRNFYEKAIDYVDDADNASQLRAEINKIWRG